MNEENNIIEETVVVEEEEVVEKKPDGINALAILSYIGILFLIPLLAAKEDEFAQYHAKQGMVLFIFSLAGIFIGVIPILGWVLAPFIFLFIVILAILGIINVLKGEKKEIPVIGKYAHKIKV